MNKPLRIAVVGAGPAGMYSIGHLLEEPGLNVEIDLYERLPTPWGLVRSGVAPDHPEKKLVIDRLFNYYLYRPQVRLMGNVEVGKHVLHEELADWYDAVVYAVGANSDMQMGIPGEELPGSWSTREFVAWYNGHPDFSGLNFDLSCERAVIVGNGNVALDVARILASSPDDLAKTDIADHALEALKESRIKEIVILGRRGHLQGAFNNPELEELEHLPNVDIVVDSKGFSGENEVVSGDVDWEARRKVQTLKRLVERSSHDADKKIVFRFLSSPTEIVGDGKVEQVLVMRNHLEQDETGQLKARPTEQSSLLDTGLVLRAVGYKGNPFPGLPFDDHKCVIKNHQGRVCDDSTELAGTYVTGWIKRGPKGIIGTNKQCSAQTVRHLLEDWQTGKLSAATLDGASVLKRIKDRQPNLVQRDDWRKLDQSEISAGRPLGRPRVKMTSYEDFMSVTST